MFSSTVIVASEENMSMVGEEDETTVALRSVDTLKSCLFYFKLIV